MPGIAAPDVAAAEAPVSGAAVPDGAVAKAPVWGAAAPEVAAAEAPVSGAAAPEVAAVDAPVPDAATSDASYGDNRADTGFDGGERDSDKCCGAEHNGNRGPDACARSPYLQLRSCSRGGAGGGLW